jgi:cytochrome c556
MSVWMLCACLAGLAQVVFTEDDLDRAMKAVGRNVALANAAIASKDFDGAKVRVARAREQLSPTASFWTNQKRADAVKMVKVATAELDVLDLALSSKPVDATAVAAAAAKLDVACQACHAVYREQDAATKAFRLKRSP